MPGTITMVERNIYRLGSGGFVFKMRYQGRMIRRPVSDIEEGRRVRSGYVECDPFQRGRGVKKVRPSTTGRRYRVRPSGCREIAR